VQRSDPERGDGECEAKKLGYSIIAPSQTPSARRQQVTLRWGIGGASRLRKTVIENGRFWLVPSDDKIANVIGGFNAPRAHKRRKALQ
jgi:hypothetical protein